MLIFKIVPRAEWMASAGDYDGSAHDKADGFLHFSTAQQLAETLRLYYADADDLILVAATAEACEGLKWEHSAARGEDFPHLYGPLTCDAMKMGAADFAWCGWRVCSAVARLTHPPLEGGSKWDSREQRENDFGEGSWHS